MGLSLSVNVSSGCVYFSTYLMQYLPMSSQKTKRATTWPPFLIDIPISCYEDTS